MLQNSMILKLEFQNYFRVGSGSGEGSNMDSTCIKDHGLPYIGGKHVRGIVREAVAEAEQLGWYDGIKEKLQEQHKITENLTELIFGSDGGSDKKLIEGMVTFNNAELPKDERLYLCHSGNSNLRQELFRKLSNNAIEDTTGATKEGSLRSSEVAVPVPLLLIKIERNNSKSYGEMTKYQQILWESGVTKVWDIIEDALYLIESFGAETSNGLGECLVSRLENRQGKN